MMKLRTGWQCTNCKSVYVGRRKPPDECKMDDPDQYLKPGYRVACFNTYFDKVKVVSKG